MKAETEDRIRLVRDVSYGTSYGLVKVPKGTILQVDKRNDSDDGVHVVDTVILQNEHGRKYEPIHVWDNEYHIVYSAAKNKRRVDENRSIEELKKFTEVYAVYAGNVTYDNNNLGFEAKEELSELTDNLLAYAERLRYENDRLTGENLRLTMDNDELYDFKKSMITKVSEVIDEATENKKNSDYMNGMFDTINHIRPFIRE